MPWYSKRFAEGRIALRPCGEFSEFQEVFEAFAQTRLGAAVFGRRNADASVTAYFTPYAEEFALMVSARMASAPKAEGLTLLCGDPADLRESRLRREGGGRARRA